MVYMALAVMISVNINTFLNTNITYLSQWENIVPLKMICWNMHVICHHVNAFKWERLTSVAKIGCVVVQN